MVVKASNGIATHLRNKSQATSFKHEMRSAPRGTPD